MHSKSSHIAGHLILPAVVCCLLRLFLEQFDQCSEIMLDDAGEGIQGGQQVLYSGALDLEAAFRERDRLGKGIDPERCPAGLKHRRQPLLQGVSTRAQFFDTLQFAGGVIGCVELREEVCQRIVLDQVRGSYFGCGIGAPLRGLLL